MVRLEHGFFKIKIKIALFRSSKHIVSGFTARINPLKIQCKRSCEFSFSAIIISWPFYSEKSELINYRLGVLQHSVCQTIFATGKTHPGVTPSVSNN